MDADEVEAGMAAELEELEDWLVSRREQLMRAPITSNAMGRVFMLGAISGQVWRLQRKLKGGAAAE